VLIGTWIKPSRCAAAPAVAYCGLAAFLAGWHVHEKAILPLLVLLAAAAPTDTAGARVHARLVLVLSAAGHYAQLPLLYQPAEYALSRALVMLYFVCANYALRVRLSRLEAAEGRGEDGAGGEERVGAEGRGGTGVGGVGRAKAKGTGQLAGGGQADSARHTLSARGASAGDGTRSQGLTARGASTREHPLPGRAGGAAKATPGDYARTSLPVSADPALLRWWEAAYLMEFLPLEIFTSGLHPLLFGSRLPFLPLLLTSVYCAVGVHYCTGLALVLWRQQRLLRDW
jgi:alpha-1,3-glucosyltransferase